MRDDYPTPELSTILDMMRDVMQFKENFGQAYIGKPRILPRGLFSFREKFHREEMGEYADEQDILEAALTRGDQEAIAQSLERQLDALVDSAYVILGTAYLQFGGAIFSEAWRRVHEANMKKVVASSAGDERSHRDATYDIVKPEGWVPPSHIDLVEDHSHRARGE